MGSHQGFRCQRPAHCWLCNEAMVAREGSAPSISGCRPDVMLFHHQAETGCLAWIRTKTDGVKARNAACYTTRQGMVEPEVVATSPNRIKSPVPVSCGFSSKPVLPRKLSGLHHFNACRPKWPAEPKLSERRMVLAAGFAPELATLSTSCLCWLGYASETHLRLVSFTNSCPACGSLELLRARRCEIGRNGVMDWWIDGESRQLRSVTNNPTIQSPNIPSRIGRRAG